MANKNNLRWWQKLLGQKEEPLPIETSNKPIDDRPINVALPNGRVSQPSSGGGNSTITNKFTTVEPAFLREVIPVIRYLTIYNPDVSQALHNVVTLANTGHKVFFDRSVPTDMVDKMRNHLHNKRKEWASGQAGGDGLANKLLAQLIIGGAIANEWVPAADLNGIEKVVFINPEDVVFKLNSRKTHYDAYQRPPKNSLGKVLNEEGLIKLNPNTFKYFALGGDTEIPYGIPPYIPVINKVKTQSDMEENINFIVDQLGLIGFLEVLMEKPAQQAGDAANYDSKLDNLLSQAKQRVLQGLKDGVIAGYKEDHEFKFNSFSKNYDHALKLYENNELQIASGTKQDSALWGRGYSSTETQITVVFTKMLSEFKNLHNILRANLEFGYALELRLAGFKFDYLTVRFNRSTIQDDLKFQQAEEIKIRNIMQKRIMGLIDQDQAADELDYEKPAFPEPMVDWEILAGGSTPTDEEKDSQDRKKDKNKSRSESTKKGKPMPKD